MARLILVSVFFLMSLLIVFKAPTNLLWYVSILVTEFSGFFFLSVVALLFSRFGDSRYIALTCFVGIAALVLYAMPIIGAYRMIPKVEKLFADNTGHPANVKAISSPFSIIKTITGLFAKEAAYKTITYDTSHQLTLDFYPAAEEGRRPCVIIVHGGSWAGGDSQQLPDLNSVLVKAGYNVASINYRLAPTYKYPMPVEDLHNVLTYLLTNASNLSIDSENVVLLGRSAGGQIVLSAAYTFNHPAVKGVISFYGPADMVWGMLTQPIRLY